MIALTWPRLSSVTIPSRRYQTPSRVRQTSSAAILLPMVRRIVALPFLIVPLVEMGATVVVVCAVAMRSVVGFVIGGWGVGEGDAVAGVIGGASVCALVIGVAGSCA